MGDGDEVLCDAESCGTTEVCEHDEESDKRTHSVTDNRQGLASAWGVRAGRMVKRGRDARRTR